MGTTMYGELKRHVGRLAQEPSYAPRNPVIRQSVVVAECLR
jgi:hypothetical protein